MKREEVIELLGQDWTRLTVLEAKALSSDIQLLSSINSELCSNAGKRLRPMISLLISRACGSLNDDSFAYAVASELLHNATLMHDDVADKSTTRRGRPTVSALLGANAAVLVGDFWLSKAVGCILESNHRDDAIRLCSKTLCDLAEGEMLQLEKSESCDTTEEDYLRIIYCKTASLFETTCRTAAISVDAAPELVEAAGRYALALGLAFQIKDDILDYCGEHIGKPVGVDLMEQKITLPLLGAMRNSSCEDELRAKVREVSRHPELCQELRNFVLDNGGVEYATMRLDEYIAEACDALEVFPDSPEKECLKEIARYNALRKL